MCAKNFDAVVYIHGFGSSSSGNNVQFLQTVAQDLGLKLIAVDYNSSALYETCMTAIQGHAMIQVITGGSHWFESYDILKNEIFQLFS